IAVGSVLATVIVPHPVNRAPEGRPTMTIAGVQGSMAPIDPVMLYMPEDVFANHIETTSQVDERVRGEGRELDLTEWPYCCTGRDPRENPQMMQENSQLAGEAGAPILLGTQQAVGEDQRYNHSVLVTEDGQIPYTYAKRHPVPFGEYVPARDFFRSLTDKVDLVGRDTIAGDVIWIMDMDELGDETGRVWELICFEIAYDNQNVDTVRKGAEVI